jgi:hypothetical protein
MENDDPMNIDQASAQNPPPANPPPANPQAGIHLDPQIAHQVNLALAQLNGDPPLPPDPPAPPLPDGPPLNVPKAIFGKLPLKAPNSFNGGPDSDVRTFLRVLERYFTLSQVPEHLWGTYATTFLDGKPLGLWETRMDISSAQGVAVTFTLFKELMMKFYDTLLPARRHRQEFNAIKQKDSISSFVRDLQTLVHELNDTPMQPSEGDIINRFLTGLKPAPRKYCEDNAPETWWIESDSLFNKAMHFEMNQNASTPMTTTPVTGNHNLQVIPGNNPVNRGRGRGRGGPGRFSRTWQGRPHLRWSFCRSRQGCLAWPGPWPLSAQTQSPSCSLACPY